MSYQLHFLKSNLPSYCDSMANKYDDVGSIYLLDWYICKCEFSILIFNNFS